MGQRSKATVDQKVKTIFCKRITSCLWIVVKFWYQFIFYIVTARNCQVHLQVQQQSEVTIWHQETGAIHQKPKTKITKRGSNRASGDCLRDLPEWLEEIAAHISHDSDSERLTQVSPRKHSIKTHFPKDRNCEVCLRAWMTRAPCRRRNGGAVLRAEKFGDLITADHKVLKEGG